MAIRISRKNINNEIVKKIEELSGQLVFNCYQCGNCSSGCPVVDYMDITPNQIMRLAQLGIVFDILQSATIWICSACLQCSSRCPKGIEVAKVMEALRSINLRKEISILNPRKLEMKELEELPPIALVGAYRKLTT